MNILARNFRILNPAQYNYNPVIWVVWLLGLISTGVLCYDFFSLKYYSREFWFSFIITTLIWAIIVIVNLSEYIIAAHIKRNVRYIVSKTKPANVKMVTNLELWEYKIVHPNKIKDGFAIILEKGDEAPFDCEVLDGIAYVEDPLGSIDSQGVVVGKHKPHHTIAAGAKIVSDKVMVRCIVPHEIAFLNAIVKQFRTKKQILSTESSLGIYLLFVSLVSCIQALALSLLIYKSLLEVGSISRSFFSWNVIITLCICTLPTTIGALLTSINFSTIKRLLYNKVVITNSKALDKINDIDYIFFDKTGVLTKGNRQVVQINPAENSLGAFLKALFFSSFSDRTAEGREIMRYLTEIGYKFDMENLGDVTFIPFDTEKRVSGCKFRNQTIIKGSITALQEGGYIDENDENKASIAAIKAQYAPNISIISVSQNGKIIGSVLLKDELVLGIKRIFEEMRHNNYKLGIITGDNAYNANLLASMLDIDVVYSDIKELDKGKIIDQLQAEGHKVMFIGDSFNDRIALLKADVGICFGKSDISVKKCADIIDFNDSIIKLPEIILLGKQGLTIKGAINIFSMFSDIAKYIAIMPAIFVDLFPKIKFLNFMYLHSPETALLSALAFNSIIILFFLPIITNNRVMTAIFLYVKDKGTFMTYGILGILMPFIVIKSLDYLLSLF